MSDADRGSESDSSFDDFIEEPVVAQQAEATATASPRISPPSTEQLKKVLEKIFNRAARNDDGTGKEREPVVLKRSQTLMDNLLQYPKLTRPDWKKSLVRRQLFLELGIPIDLDEVLQPKTEKLITHIYGGNELSAGRYDRVYVMLNTSTATVDKVDAQSLTQKTHDIMEAVEMGLQTRNFYEETHMSGDELLVKVKEMEKSRERLITLCKEWLKRKDDVKSDNEIFESYIENMVANTQRFRRLQIKK